MKNVFFSVVVLFLVTACCNHCAEKNDTTDLGETKILYPLKIVDHKFDTLFTIKKGEVWKVYANGIISATDNQFGPSTGDYWPTGYSYENGGIGTKFNRASQFEFLVVTKKKDGTGRFISLDIPYTGKDMIFDMPETTVVYMTKRGIYTPKEGEPFIAYWRVK